MPSVVKVKRSSVPGKAPNVADLQIGEIAINLADGVLYSRNSTHVISISGGGSTISNSDIQNYLSNIDGNIVPSADEVYSLGSADRKFKDLYLSGNTIVLGSIAIKDEGGSFQVAKATVDRNTGVVQVGPSLIRASEENTGITQNDLTTSNVVELSNLYFTNARVYSNVIQLNYATTSYVDSAIADLIDSSPTTLDTLNELAAALGDDPNFATTTVNLIGSSFTQANTALVAAQAAFDSSNSKTVSADLTTSNVVEVTNLYFTNARARAAFTAGSNITIDANGVISSTATGGGGSLTYSVDTFTGDNSTSTFNLTSSPSSNVSLLISFDGVKQHVSEYTVTNSSLTFNNAPESNVSIEVIHLPSEGGGGSSGATETWTEVTSDQTLESSNKYMVNTSSGPITVTLPSSPSLGDTVYILDATNSFSSNSCLIARNNSKIMGVEDDLLADTNGSYFGLVYYNSTYGWRILQ